MQHISHNCTFLNPEHVTMSCCAVVLDNLVALSGIIGIVVEQSGLGAAVWRLRLMGSMHQQGRGS